MSDIGNAPELDNIAIVAIGAFNPMIFHPRWFADMHLLPKDEAESADVQIIHHDAAIFDADWLSIQVLKNRFVAATSDPAKSHPLRDLVLGTFGILEHTPVSAWGVNVHQHFRMRSEDEWHALGHRLAPKDTWNELLEKPGLLSLTIFGKRTNSDATSAQIKVEPSRKIHPGVYIHVNEHYQLDADDNASQSDRMLRFLTGLSNSWDGFLSYCNSSTLKIVSENGATTSALAEQQKEKGE